MKPCLRTLFFVCLLSPLSLLADQKPSESRSFSITTKNAGITLEIGKDGRLYQTLFAAKKATPPSFSDKIKRQREFYPQWGDGYFNEPALQVTHADGNTSTSLVVIKEESKRVVGPGMLGKESTKPGDKITLTRVELKDPAYPFFVTLFFKAYEDLDIIEQWAEIRHEEPGPVRIERFASSSPLFPANDLYLTQFSGSYGDEMNPRTERLGSGIKVLDSKLAVRAHQNRHPNFLLSWGGAPQENEGEVWAGALAWPGSFQFAFEQTEVGTRALCGMNPFASQYNLEAGQVFTTPAMTWAYSPSGVGTVSRNLHRYVRTYALRDGDRPRDVLLNNWEATFFKFDEKKLVSLFDGAKELGMDLFLLDDGWFGVKHPRDSDNAGLGDWKVNTAKLPNGIGYLCEEAAKRGLRFGIWVEPEMVNPKSELFEKHPDWVIRQPSRALEEQRFQLVLDLTRPEVKEFVIQTVDDLLKSNPGISFVKWDCNRFVTQPGSPWLKKESQSHLGIEYNKAILDIMREISVRHPKVEMMVCAGGGGRVDYGSLRYFHEFWPSDNTDPLRRVPMQWDFSTFFPAITMAAHVTDMGKRPLKFAFDVAMSARLGMDMDLSKLSPEELAFAASAIKTYKDRLLPVVQLGELYRLESPHTGPRAALNYVSEDRSRAAVFVLQTKEGPATPVKPAGLDPAKRYTVREWNLPQGASSSLPADAPPLSGETLMTQGIPTSCTKACDSMVLELVAE